MMIQAPELESQYEANIYSKRGLTLVRGSGSRVFDDTGKEYIDCVAGHGVASLGHCHPDLIEAVDQQMRTLVTCPGGFHNDVRAEYMQALAQVTPPGLDRFFFCNSGTEAVEAALKFARLTTGRSGYVATKRGFHGRTMGSLSVTWNYREGFEPLIPDVAHVIFGDCEELGAQVNENTAAVILEVVQGEGGVHAIPKEYYAYAHKICEERGALLIVDEVQTGFGRTGKWFAVEHFGLSPDMITLAKGIAGGLPMGAVALGPKVKALKPSVHGTTFGGNPLVARAALTVLKVMDRDQLPDRAKELGERFIAGLEAIPSPVIREVRGLGLMVGVDLRSRVTPYLRKLQEYGVLALPAGSTVLRFLPPLTISWEDLATVLQRVQTALEGE